MDDGLFRRNGGCALPDRRTSPRLRVSSHYLKAFALHARGRAGDGRMLAGAGAAAHAVLHHRGNTLVNMLLIRPPACEPVAAGDVLPALGHAARASVTMIACLLAAARMVCETRTGLALIEQDWRLTFDCVPPDGVLALPVAPVGRIIGAGVAPCGGPLRHADQRDVQLVTGAGTGAPHLVISGDLAGRAGSGDVALVVDVTAGLARRPENVPPRLRRAIVDLAVHWFRTREPIGFGDPDVPVPDAIAAALDGFAAEFRGADVSSSA